jgi:hypothetical protein
MLILSCQELAQEARESFDCCKLVVEHEVSMILYNLTSSAKSFTRTISLHAAATSLMYIKDIGPRTEPCIIIIIIIIYFAPEVHRKPYIKQIQIVYR